MGWNLSSMERSKLVETDIKIQEQIKTFFPVFRKFNTDTDIIVVNKFLMENGYGLPFDDIIYAAVCLLDGEIVGFSALLCNHFVEPLAVKQDLGLYKKIRIMNSMLFMIGGVATFLRIKRLYFMPNLATEKFVGFLQKQFKIREFIEKKVFVVEI